MVLGEHVFHLFLFMRASCWRNDTATRIWKEVLRICTGVWQQTNVSILAKAQGGEGKSHRGTDHLEFPSPVFRFSVLPPLNTPSTNAINSRGVMSLHKMQWSFHNRKAVDIDRWKLVVHFAVDDVFSPF